MGIPVLQFDGIVEIWVNGVDEYQRHMSRADIIEVLYGEGKLCSESPVFFADI